MAAFQKSYLVEMGMQLLTVVLGTGREGMVRSSASHTWMSFVGQPEPRILPRDARTPSLQALNTLPTLLASTYILLECKACTLAV